MLWRKKTIEELLVILSPKAKHNTFLGDILFASICHFSGGLIVLEMCWHSVSQGLLEESSVWMISGPIYSSIRESWTQTLNELLPTALCRVEMELWLTSSRSILRNASFEGSTVSLRETDNLDIPAETRIIFIPVLGLKVSQRVRKFPESF